MGPFWSFRSQSVYTCNLFNKDQQRAFACLNTKTSSCATHQLIWENVTGYPCLLQYWNTFDTFCKNISLLRYKYIFQIYLCREVQILKSISKILLWYSGIKIFPVPVYSSHLELWAALQGRNMCHASLCVFLPVLFLRISIFKVPSLAGVECTLKLGYHGSLWRARI